MPNPLCIIQTNQGFLTTPLDPSWPPSNLVFTYEKNNGKEYQSLQLPNNNVLVELFLKKNSNRVIIATKVIFRSGNLVVEEIEDPTMQTLCNYLNHFNKLPLESVLKRRAYFEEIRNKEANREQIILARTLAALKREKRVRRCKK